ncbi:hypothetical protein EG68_11401 [Paragonimus skrjabini miyazakii]|uniref:Uncharacterized protein n=1 Tax=Paragonimus skrjabini miyazakii TaxID=59628 RepID=A0A8S9YGI7_9TREM|nr:hypothetical protein EG68_11401 [Paragonimus skrjabini miyazakii]
MLLLIPSAETPVSRLQVALAIVLVVLQHAGRGTHACAFLDSGSDATLIRKSLVKGLGSTGRSKRRILNTLNQCSTLISTQVELNIESVDSKAVVHLARA